MASSLRNNTEKRLSTPSENNLESITEEKDTKDVMSSDAEVQDTQGTVDSDATQAANTSTADSDKTLDIFLEDNVDEKTKSNLNEPVCPKEENSEVNPEDKHDDEPNVDATQTIIDIGEVPAVSFSHLDHNESSSSSSSSSDDDADDALRNLEGFTPLVDLKFKK